MRDPLLTPRDYIESFLWAMAQTTLILWASLAIVVGTAYFLWRVFA
jgi:hypothetical protein